MSAFKLNLYTPSGVVVRDLHCESLIIPTESGMINVLKGHTHVLSKLGTGILVATTDMGKRHFSCTAGLVKVLKDTVTILSYTSEKPEQIDIERAKSAEAKANSRLQGKESLSEEQYIKFRRKLDRAKLRIDLSKLK